MRISLTDDSATGPALDITAPGHVEVEVRTDGRVLWVNVDGVCRLRVCQIPSIKVIDHTRPLRVE